MDLEGPLRFLFFFFITYTLFSIQLIFLNCSMLLTFMCTKWIIQTSLLFCMELGDISEHTQDKQIQRDDEYYDGDNDNDQHMEDAL